MDPDEKAPPDGRIDHGVVRDLFVLASRLGLPDEASEAARAIGDHPQAVTPDRMLPAALAEGGAAGEGAGDRGWCGLMRQGPQSVSVADVARDLAYRLYSISDRKKRAPEALQYNSLVGSWSEIRRLARAEVHPRATGAVRAPRWGEGSVSVEIRNLEG